MTVQFEGQTVFITGAGRGLGARLVQSALEAGAAKVWAGVRDPERLPHEVLTDRRVVAVRIDITDQTSIDAAARRATDVSILINNGGVLGFGDALEGDLQVFERDILTNGLGPLRVTRSFAPILERNAPSAVINILTVTALAPVPSMAGYCASKAAGHSITQSLRAELTDRGITVIGAYPGPIDTDMLNGVDIDKTAPEEVATGIVEGVQAGQTMIWPDPASTGAGTAYLADPLALEEFMARQR